MVVVDEKKNDVKDKATSQLGNELHDKNYTQRIVVNDVAILKASKIVPLSLTLSASSSSSSSTSVKDVPCYSAFERRCALMTATLLENDDQPQLIPTDGSIHNNSKPLVKLSLNGLYSNPLTKDSNSDRLGDNNDSSSYIPEKNISSGETPKMVPETLFISTKMNDTVEMKVTGSNTKSNLNHPELGASQIVEYVISVLRDAKPEDWLSV